MTLKLAYLVALKRYKHCFTNMALFEFVIL
jgi:hypothetical protein